MAHRYLQELSTPSVLAARERYGSLTSTARLIDGGDTDDRLGRDEIDFVSARDGFHLATVAENGWPYVQYRGGPPGFLRVLDDTTLGWADFRGNRQYLSVGNLGATPRVALLLMDLAARRRLKILGTAEVVDVRAARDPAAADLAARLTVPGHDARVERAVVVRVHAYDWNCPQHITPRYSAAELAPALEPLHEELARLRAENDELRRRVDAAADRRP
jgi:hypothetical protein